MHALAAAWLGPLACVAACALQEPLPERGGAAELAYGPAVEAWDGAQHVDQRDAGAGSGVEVGDGALIVLPEGEAASGPPSRALFRVTTQSQGGRYAPKNIGAIWVEDAAGEWVKTLAVWASVRERYLDEYHASNPSRNKLDAVTGATLREHATHEVVWDLRDAEGDRAPDGEYTIFVEATDRDASGQFIGVAFVLSSEPSHVAVEDTPAFANVTLDYE